MSKVEGQETRLGLTLDASGLQPLSNGLIYLEYFIVNVIGGVAAVPSWIGDA